MLIYSVPLLVGSGYGSKPARRIPLRPLSPRSAGRNGRGPAVSDYADFVWPKNSKPADEIEVSEAAQLLKTDLKQVIWGMESGGNVSC